MERDQRELLEEAVVLLEREEESSSGFHDYAFVVFPAAKAYEGFLKKLFLDLGLITREQYEGDHFRIGKSLSPNLPERFRDHDWVWEKLSRFCGGVELPKVLWGAWKESRNSVFHWFPREENFISLEEARRRVGLILKAISRAFVDCRVKQ